MKLTLIGLSILIVLVVCWGIGVWDGSFYYQEEYDDYTLIIGIQAILLLFMLGIFILVDKDDGVK